MGGWQSRFSNKGEWINLPRCRNMFSLTFFCHCKLLDHEPRACDQVPLLLTMKEDRLALLKAVDSGDTDLGTVSYFILRATMN